MSTKPTTLVARCLNCSNVTPHDIIANYMESEYDEGVLIEEYYYRVLRCGTCKRVAVHFAGDEESQSLWPNSSYLGPHVPAGVRKHYEDSFKVKRLPSAYAVCIRKGMEAICRDKNVKGRDLADSFSKLVSTHGLPPIAKDIGDASRMLGNRGAHDGEDEVTKEEAEMLHELFLAIVEYVYIAPAKVGSYLKALAKLKK